MLPHSWLTSLLPRRPLKRGDSKSETSNNAVAPQALDFTGGDAEPVVQNFRAVLPKRRRSFQPYCLAVDPHRPGRHLVVAVVVMDGLHDTALLEARLVLQFHRVEHGAGRHTDGNEFLHCLALVVLARPFADDRVELPFVRDTVIAGRKTRVLNQFLTADQLHQPRPVLRVGPAGGQVDIVVGATALGRVKPRGSVVAAARFGAVAPRRFAGARHIRETRAHVVDHRASSSACSLAGARRSSIPTSSPWDWKISSRQSRLRKPKRRRLIRRYGALAPRSGVLAAARCRIICRESSSSSSPTTPPVLRRNNACHRRRPLTAARRDPSAIPGDRHAPTEIRLPPLPGSSGSSAGAGPADRGRPADRATGCPCYGGEIR